MRSAPSALPETAIIIGGGVVGLCCASALQRRGIATTLLVAEGGEQQSASWGNAGHIAVEQAEPLASPAMLRTAHRRLFLRGGALSLPLREMGVWLPFVLRLQRASAPARFERGKAALGAILATAMPAWRRLLAAAGVPELLRESGHFIVWERDDSAARGRAHWRAAATGMARSRDATDDELVRLAGLTPAAIAGAMHFEGSGQIADLGELLQMLRRHFKELGGEIRTARALRVESHFAGASAILESGETLSASVVVVAAGIGSRELLAPLGMRVPMIAERGYHIHSAGTNWPEDMPPVVFEDQSMIVTRFRSGLRAASFVELGRAASPPDPRKWARLRRHVAALRLSFPGPLTEWMGARPTLPDYLPAIGRCRDAPAICYAFGHQHLGLTLAATTGEAMGALLAGGPAPFPLHPFDLDRFRRSGSRVAA